ncbi:hypothetical protein [Dehalogenimonas etheniformans]|uniref:Uncharacterized protein n=1 Tax=Dehalogenimonas etheniformans TaxID=1536648 RepID=A0A2P5P7E4_9CHLR|nr:hypothetical protein [Dehalogenimonas etheniformans]PPD58205.1 hypothetical protein JP09_005285 [Dehalogenimonas etheniformans]QNT75615.1 hypothetical protein HX448_02385 [Dehalogenimonas etheniformans]
MKNGQELQCYREALDDHKEAKRIISEISKLTAEVSNCLSTEPYRLTISGFGMDMPLKPEFAGKQLVCAPGQWPTEQNLAEAVNRQYKTEKALHKAWAKLSPEEKKQVEPPPASK